MLVLNMVRLVMVMNVSENFGDFVTICDMLGLKVWIFNDVEYW